MKLLRTAFAAAAILLCTSLSAQVGEHRSDFAVGVNGGYTLNKVTFNPTIKQTLHGGPTMGVTLRYTCEKYFAVYCALQAEINYARLGWKELIETSTDTYSREMDYIQVPFFARLALGKERGGFQGFLLLGPQIGFCIGDKERKGGEWSNYTLSRRPNGIIQQYGLEIDNRFEYGISGGLGAEVSTKSGHRFAIEGRYFYGLSDIFANSKKDPFGRSNNGTIFAKVAYLFDIIKTK